VFKNTEPKQSFIDEGEASTNQFYRLLCGSAGHSQQFLIPLSKSGNPVFCLAAAYAANGVRVEWQLEVLIPVLLFLGIEDELPAAIATDSPEIEVKLDRIRKRAYVTLWVSSNAGVGYAFWTARKIVPPPVVRRF
jgi:hypothetical protein